jgi:hypothetical protein
MTKHDEEEAGEQRQRSSLTVTNPIKYAASITWTLALAAATSPAAAAAIKSR